MFKSFEHSSLVLQIIQVLVILFCYVMLLDHGEVGPTLRIIKLSDDEPYFGWEGFYLCLSRGQKAKYFACQLARSYEAMILVMRLLV